MSNLTRPQQAHTTQDNGFEDVELGLEDFIDPAPTSYTYTSPYRKSGPIPPRLRDSRSIILPYQLSQQPSRRASSPYDRCRKSWYKRPWNFRGEHLIIFVGLIAAGFFLTAIVFQIARIAGNHDAEDAAVV
ncbi:hypothetical protein IFR05_007269 [Cadophora sp. M221]|nr:hypothetical protein IFR05_007269 [Cadophora sp. M221]